MEHHFELRQSIHDPILHGTIYQPDSVFSVILFIHDVNESRFRYEPLARYFNQRHMTFVTYDLRGHHKSLIKNQKGHFGDDGGASRLLQDVIDVTQYIKEQYPHAKILLMGQGIGAYLAMLAFDYNPHWYSQLILVNPNSLPRFHKVKLALLNLMTYRQPSMVKPHLNKWMGVTIDSKESKQRYSFLSHNPKIISEYIHDPFCGYQLSGRAIRDVIEIMDVASKTKIEAAEKEIMISILGGKDDPLTYYGRDLVAIKRRFIESGYGLVTLNVFDKIKHDLLLEIESQPHISQLFEKICYNQL